MQMLRYYLRHPNHFFMPYGYLHCAIFGCYECGRRFYRHTQGCNELWLDENA